jgi:two-component system, LuxR family, sensor kinase FixL
MSNNLFESRYAETTERLSRVNVVSATMIWLLAVVDVWGHWRTVAVVLGLQLLLIPFNIFVNLVLIRRRGIVTGEVSRTLVNLVATVVFCHVAHWPLSVWLWLPYMSQAFDHLDKRVATGVLVAFCLTLDVVALRDGVPWMYPLAFTALAFHCSLISKIRFGAIHDMLQRSDEQRAEIRNALDTLHESQAKLASLVEHTDDVICSVDTDLNLVAMNASFCDLIRWSGGREPEIGAPLLESVAPDRRALWADRCRAVLCGERVRAEQALTRGNARRVLEILLNPILGLDGAVTGITLFGRDITARREVEERAAAMRHQLLDITRKAGMAEVATSVLHNVGNALNSITVSAALLHEAHQQSKAPGLTRAVDLLSEHAADLGAFLTEDPRGRRLPQYLRGLADAIGAERQKVAEELQSLQTNIDHVKVIVSMQQSHAKVGGLVEPLSLSELLDDAIKLNITPYDGHLVEVVRSYAELPIVHADRHRLFQIVTNLLSNARHAVKERPEDASRITVRTARIDDSRVSLEVEDSGVGIVPENLTRIFNHGFTTKKDGHGFGLHSSACAAKEMGGSLTARSEGPGRGAIFTLVLPMEAPARA